MDQRIQHTRYALQSSLRELMGRTTWDRITIKMLCDSASISRTTFYANFRSKEECLDSLLDEFENAMRSENNGRSLVTSGCFTFLPILLNHVNGNRSLFATTNTTAAGYPVAERFRHMINRLVLFELQQASVTEKPSAQSVNFIAGGIYNSLVQWSGTTKDGTHLKLLDELDSMIKKYLRLNIQKVRTSEDATVSGS